MPHNFICEICEAESPTIEGWFIISVIFAHYDVNAPVPPGGRMVDSTAPDLYFDRLECREKWCKKAGIEDPGPPVFVAGRLPVGGELLR